ncbi:MAG: hypothetical protein IPM48_14160 [Saprospiraceae bacterium]|nr:hypothetical protein [Saprospiraceae bacterium]
MKNTKRLTGLYLFIYFLVFASFSPTIVSGQCTCVNPGLVNGGFEAWGVPAGGIAFFGSSNGWTTTCGIEVWGSGYLGVPSHEGSNYIELNSNCLDRLYQDVCTVPGASYEWSIAHRGRVTVEIAHLEMGPPAGPFTNVQLMSDGTGSWGVYSGIYLVPAGQTTTRIRLVAITGSCGPTCGNLIDAFSFNALDTDGDGTADCIDECPSDPDKIVEGQCGCGFPDTDSDGDGTADCIDACADDPTKTEPGICGCGVVDTDTDGDGTADCEDNCPEDDSKTEPGQCGCGNAETDSDCDGIADCNDVCPGGDDSVDNNGDLIPDCSQLLNYSDYSDDWKCGANKIIVCHNGNNPHSICINKNALAAHYNHGDNIGPCTTCGNALKVLVHDKDTDGDHDHPAEDIGMETMRIVPNPASDYAEVWFEGLNEDGCLYLLDLHGKVFWQSKLFEGQKTIKLDHTILNGTNGTFIIRLVTEHKIITKHLVLIR